VSDVSLVGAGTGALPVDLSGDWRVHPSDGDLARRFTDPSIPDADWHDVCVPGHWQSYPELARHDGPMLYRRTFAPTPLAPGDRRFVSFDGIFYYGDIWLDGGYLGVTEGYFFPHTFEVTDQARRAPDEGHLLAVEVACPPQLRRSAKRTVTGVFSHWDNLDPAWNPGGIWRPVRLRDTGPVRIKWLRVLCREATEERGRLLLDVTLDRGADGDGDPMAARLFATVSGPDGTPLADITQDVVLAAGDNTLSLTVDVDRPPRWWPWRLGDQPQCDVEVRVEVAGAPSDFRRLRTAFREVRIRNWQMTVNGERMFPMGSNHGPTRMALADATIAELMQDVQLAVDANLDLLRIHAHVTRVELYDAADAAGLLVWQDLPLQWGYARGTRKEAVRQAHEMVDLLGHHPSIALWCAHNEPLAIDLQPGESFRPRDVARTAVSMFLPSWNKDVLDRSVARALRRADPTRSVNPHSGVLPGVGSGGTDTHFYFGWYHGRMDGLAPALRAMPRLARFVTEFGAQAVPDTADFMEPQRWPHLDWERLFEHHSLQKLYFDQHVPPALFDTFAGWREATQHYQAALIQLQVEDLRRLKHTPTGGFCHFCFADGHPAVTWSVLDHARVPKLGYAALRDACRTVLPMLEPRTGQVHVVSESRVALPGAVVEAEVDGGRCGWVGDVPADGLVYIGELELPADANRVTLTLRHPSLADVVNSYDDVLEWLRIVSG
jgi:beta-mannosidase